MLRRHCCRIISPPPRFADADAITLSPISFSPRLLRQRPMPPFISLCQTFA